MISVFILSILAGNIIPSAAISPAETRCNWSDWQSALSLQPCSVVAVLGPGDFVGEACLAGQPNCMATATAIAPTTVLVIEKDEMSRVLHKEPALSDRFISHMLARNIQVEESLIDQLFNSSEKRLARTLLLLARYGAPGRPHKVLPKVSQEMLAEMIGTTRSRVNFFMNKFRKLGFIRYDGGIHISDSLLNVVLHD
jgi:CRP/FNR family cyclic AMP-dependent transcriptional regulator